MKRALHSMGRSLQIKNIQIFSQMARIQKMIQIYSRKQNAHSCSRRIGKATLQMILDKFKIVSRHPKIHMANSCVGYFIIN